MWFPDIVDRALKTHHTFNILETQHYAYAISPNKHIICNGINMIIDNNISKHAEYDLINKLNRIPNVKTNRIDILVIKLSKNGYLGSSKPCMHCLNIMYKSKYKIRYIYYSNNNREIVREKFTQMDTNHISMGNKWKLGLLVRN
jgi:hypothetical protein